jgi:hypothetical protein
MRGTKYEQQHLKSFTGSRSEAETRSIMRRIDSEDEDRKTLDAAGMSGVLMNVLAGTVDPTILLPSSIAVRSGKAGYEFTRAAINVGAAGALQAGVQESILHGTQETRTAGESLMNAASGTVLAGLIGGAASRLLTSAEHGALVQSLDKARVDMDAHANPRPAAPAPPPVSSAPPLIPEPAASDVLGFKTAKGSTYELHPDGTTTRNKAARSDLGHEGDFGPKERSAKTVFVDPADAPLFNPPDNTKWRIIDHGDGTLSLATLRDDGRWGISPSDRNINTETAPRVGLSPVELWKSDTVNGLPAYRGVHPGNPITEMQGATPAGLGVAQSAGAAATDIRTLEMPSSIPGTKNLSTTRRTLESESVVARRAMADTAETPYSYKQSAEGVAAYQGPPVDRVVKMAKDGTHYEVGQELDRLFVDYRFGPNAPTMARMRAGIDDMLGRVEGKMSFGDFKKQVGEAMMFGDQHAIPQVAEAAQFIRAKVWSRGPRAPRPPSRASSGSSRRSGESYFPHAWNKEKIKAQRPELHRQADRSLQGRPARRRRPRSG